MQELSPAQEYDDSISMATVTKKPTSFLDLPAELRNEIYRLAVPSERCVFEPWRHFTGYCGLIDLGGPIGREANAYYYGNNYFYMMHDYEARAFVSSLQPSIRSSIRHLRLDYIPATKPNPEPLHMMMLRLNLLKQLCAPGLEGLRPECVFVWEDGRWIPITEVQGWLGLQVAFEVDGWDIEVKKA